MKKLFTLFAAAMASLSMMAIDWQGTTPATDGTTQYYVYNVKQGKWLVDQQTYNGQNGLGMGGSYKGQALADQPVAWTLNGSLANTFKMISANNCYLAIYDRGWASRVVTSEKTATDKNTQMKSSLVDGNYSIYSNEKVGGTGRNIYSSSATCLEVQADASYEWRFVSMEEYADSMRTFTVLETIEATVGVEIEIFNKPYTFSEVGDVTINDTLQSVLGFDSVLVQPVHVVEPIHTALPENKEAVKAVKVLRNGQLLIRREDALFDLRGQRVK